MPRTPRLAGIGLVIALGSAWGLAEAGLGLALQACARLASGAIMTGVAVFFLTGSRLRARRAWGPALAVALAMGLKLFDAALLGLPVKSGAIGNPLFAFLVEAAVFVAVFAAFGRAAGGSFRGRFLMGAGTGLVSALAFPAVAWATGIPACVMAGTSIPLSIAFAPVAALAGGLAVPLAYRVVPALEAWQARRPGLRFLLPAAAAALSLAFIAVLRLA